MKCILIGFGEIGKAIYEVYSKYHKIDVIDPNYPSERMLDEYDLMLITIPNCEKFVEIIADYQKEFKAKAKIVFSTVAIGTTKKLIDAVHVPIEGKHPNLAQSIENWQVFMGGYNSIAYDFFIQAEKYPMVIKKSEHTEAMKMLSTTMYGINIEFARYCNEIFKNIGMDYDKFNNYNACYNQLYTVLGMPQFSRYLLQPPEGSKGGHCVTNNALILQKQYPNPLIDIVAEVTLPND